MKFQESYQKFKKTLFNNAIDIQTEFNIEISNGWNLLLKKDDVDNNIVEFVLMVDGERFEGDMQLVGDDYEISWESESPLKNEGLVQGEDLETVLKRMVTGINFNRS